MTAAQSSCQPMKSGRHFRHGLLLLWAMGLCQTMGGCLAFRDFELVEGAPCTGEYGCSGHTLYECNSGVQIPLEDCREAGKWCDAPSARCVDCRPEDKKCEGTVLQTCVDGAFVESMDCWAARQYCFDGACVPCVSERTYCADETHFFKCVNNQVPDMLPSNSSCNWGCLNTGVGDEGACANCPAAFQDRLWCPTDTTTANLYRCPTDRTERLSTPEVLCPAGCQPNTDVCL